MSQRRISAFITALCERILLLAALYCTILPSGESAAVLQQQQQRIVQSESERLLQILYSGDAASQ